MTPEAKAIIDNASALDQKYNDIGQELAGANANLGVSQQTVQQMQAQLSTAAANTNAMQAQLDAARAQLLTPSGAAIGLHLLPFHPNPKFRGLLQFFQPDNTGDTGGGSGKKNGTFTAATPTDDAIRAITWNPNYANNNAFFGLNLIKGDTDFSKYKQTLVVELRDENIAFCQGIETNWEHCRTGGVRFNQGTQLLVGEDMENGKKVSHVVRYYDISAGGWHTIPGIPFPAIGTGKLITVVNEIQRTDAGMTFVSITLNGVRYPVGVTTKPRTSAGWGAYLQYGWQMDALGGTSYKSYTTHVHDMQAAWA